MLEQLKKQQEQFYKQAIAPVFKGHISHAYFIETSGNQIDLVKQYVREFCKQLFLYKLPEDESFTKTEFLVLFDRGNFPDYIEIVPDNNTIKKEQLLNVKEQFKDKSLYHTYQIYVVYESEKLNTSSANTILKFLEEPEEDIVAIFVANNRYSVINTILSRCSTITLKQEIQQITHENFDENLLDFFHNVLDRQSIPLLLHYKKYQETLFKTKEEAIQNLNSVLMFMKALWNNKLSSNLVKLEYQDNFSLTEILEIIDILEKSLSKLRYNVNLKLWLDEVLLNLTEVSK